jgi:hypothetical protein
MTNLTTWNGLPIPPCHFNINMTFEARIGNANDVPYVWTDEGASVKQITADDTLNKECLDLIWTITGETVDSQRAFKEAGVHANKIIAGINANVYHYAHKLLVSKHPLHKPVVGTPGTPRYFLVRVYLNHQFDCTEHPEMWLGSPLGMYHCAVCGDMQVAGLPHISEKMVDEYRASEA